MDSVGAVQGWSVMGHPGDWKWSAFVGAEGEEGHCTKRSYAEACAQAAHRKLLDKARRQMIRPTESEAS